MRCKYGKKIQYSSIYDTRRYKSCKLVDGMTAEKINELLSGNTCGRKPTSCADQLATAVMEAVAKI